MSQTLNLYRLQQIDSQMDRLRARLQVIKNILADDAEQKAVMEQVELARTLALSADQSLKQAEIDTRNLRIKIEQVESSLYKGKGHTPKELLDLQNDLEALNRHMLTLEDVQLEAMLTVEKSQSVAQAAEQELLVVQNRFAFKNLDLQEENTVLLRELGKLIAQRTAVSTPVPEEALELYERLRLQRRGIAVASISDGSCSACGSGLSAAQIQSSRASAAMAFCPSCGRILYGS